MKNKKKETGKWERDTTAIQLARLCGPHCIPASQLCLCFYFLFFFLLLLIYRSLAWSLFFLNKCPDCVWRLIIEAYSVHITHLLNGQTKRNHTQHNNHFYSLLVFETVERVCKHNNFLLGSFFVVTFYPLHTRSSYIVSAASQHPEPDQTTGETESTIGALKQCNNR